MLIDGFNTACKNIAASFLKFEDESMSAIRFQTTAIGDLPHLSYIFCKPEPLGKEFKKVACSVTGAFLFIEVHRGKSGVNHSKFQKDIGATAACTNRMMEATKWIGQKSIKGETKDCFLFDSCFVSKNAAEAAMEAGAESIGIVKTNTKRFCKDTIEKLTNDWSGGSYPVLRSKPMVSGYRLNISICCRYNVRKVLSFIFTDSAGRTKNGIPYLSNYPDQFTYVYIRPVARPLVMSKNSVVNEVDSHNKSIQSDLELNMWWVTQCGWLWLCAEVAMGMTIIVSLWG